MKSAAALDERFELLELMRSELAERNFQDYFKTAWRILEPDTKLLWNWHHGMICEYLQACYTRQIKRLIINVEPRSLKSYMSTVAFPTWVWVNKPTERFLFGSHDASLSTKHSVDRRRLIESEWYQARWGRKVELTTDQNIKTHYENTMRGHMIAASMTGSGIGKGGNFIILDDPHDPLKAESDVQRGTVLQSIDQKFSTRLDDKKNGVIMLIMQRVHELDATHHLKEKGGWTNVIIPAVQPEEKVYVFPISKREEKREAGALMQPEREGQSDLEQQERDMGSYAYNAQYLQEPVARGGNLIKIKHFNIIDTLPEKFDEVITFWDMATKEKPENKKVGKRSYVVGLVAGRIGVKKYLLFVWRKQVGFAQSAQAVIQLRKSFPASRRILVEDKANGPAIVNVLKKKISGIMEWPVGAQDKEQRYYVIEPDFEAGNWHIPNPEKNVWASEFLDEIKKFPKGANDDQVDAWTGAGGYFVQRESKWRKLAEI